MTIILSLLCALSSCFFYLSLCLKKCEVALMWNEPNRTAKEDVHDSFNENWLIPERKGFTLPEENTKLGCVSRASHASQVMKTWPVRGTSVPPGYPLLIHSSESITFKIASSGISFNLCCRVDLLLFVLLTQPSPALPAPLLELAPKLVSFSFPWE